MKIVLDMLRGLAMSIADSVPGVSGGTVAFLLGFYDKFIFSLNNLISGKKGERKEAAKFLVKLGIGWVVGLSCCVLLISNLFNTYIYEISSLFLGLTLFAVPVVIAEEKDNLKGKYYSILFALLGVAVVAAITYFSPASSSQGTGIDFLNANFGTYVLVFFAGMIAITAMVLPGISGSTIMLIMGLYVPIINAVKELLHMKFEYFPMLLTFGVGVIVGVLLVIKLVKLCLERFRAQMVFFIIGLMVGSLYAIVMGPSTLAEPKPPITFETFSVIPFIIGGAVIIIMKLVSHKSAKKLSNKPKHSEE